MKEFRLIRKVGQVLRCEDNARILLTHILEVFAQFFFEDWVIKEKPALIQNDNGRPFCTANLRFDPMKQVFQRCRDDGRRRHKSFHFVYLPKPRPGYIFAVVKEFSMTSLHRESFQGLPNLLILHEFAETGQGAPFDRKLLQRQQGLPDKIILCRRDLDIALFKIGDNPLFCPFRFMVIVNICERLKRQLSLIFTGNVVKIASDSKSKCAAGCRLVKDEYVAVRIFKKMRFNSIEEDGFSRSGRPHNHCMTNFPDMQGESKWCIA